MKPRQVFVDASAWIAIIDRRESTHALAARLYANLLASQTLLVTTDLVLSEVYILLRRRVGYEAAQSFLENVYASSRIEIVYANADLAVEARQILQQYRDHDLSLTDAISFAFMKQEKINEAFTLDRHFAVAGYSVLPLT